MDNFETIIKKASEIYNPFKPSKRDLMLSIMIHYKDVNFQEISIFIDNGDYTTPDNIPTEKLKCKEDIIKDKFYKNMVTYQVGCVSSVKENEVSYMYMMFGPAFMSCSIENFLKYFELCPDVNSFQDIDR